MDWQSTLALFCVLAAAGWLLRRLWHTGRAQVDSGCGGGCSACDRAVNSSPADPQQNFVALDHLLDSVDRTPPR